ncbi:MAG: hypothetical protein ACKVS6_06050 [Planctomycetota bacterium]
MKAISYITIIATLLLVTPACVHTGYHHRVYTVVEPVPCPPDPCPPVYIVKKTYTYGKYYIPGHYKVGPRGRVWIEGHWVN